MSCKFIASWLLAAAIGILVIPGLDVASFLGGIIFTIMLGLSNTIFEEIK